MASVILQGNALVVRFNDGSTRASGITVSASMTEADIQGAIGRARSNVAAYFYGAGDDRKGQEASSASGNARGIFRQLHPEAREEHREETPTPPPRSAPRHRERQAPEPRPARPARSEERRDTRRATPRRVFPESAADVRTWLETQFHDSQRDERHAQTAISLLQSHRSYIEQYLSPDLQRGVQRTENQKEATITVFNSLYQIPSFRLYLSSMAASQRDTFPEFASLQAFLTEPGRPESLSEQASAEIVRAADTYIRYYLLNFVAPNSAFSRYREELTQRTGDQASLPALSWRLGNIDSARTFTPTSGRGPSEADRSALMKLYLSGPMDSDTMVAAALFIRRWTQEHPERGRARTQDQIAVWQAPQLVPLEGAAQPQPAQPATAVVPRVAVIGDSIIAGNRIGDTLQTSLRRQSSGASVDSYGIVSDPLTSIRDRFRRDVLGHRPAYNAVVLEGGLNSIMTLSVERAESIFTEMITAAREHGMRVVLVGLVPWAGSTNSSSEGQRRTALLNQWLRDQARSDGSVVFVDSAALIGEGNPPRLRSQYERETDPDHLHPNSLGRDLIARQIAQAAYSVSTTTTERRSALQEFADRNWRNLAAEIYRGVHDGRPAGIITLMRTLPSGQSTIEGALGALNRDDIERSYDRIFNDYLHRDPDFLSFVRSRRDYSSLERPSVTLSASSSATDRRLIIRAMQEFVNYTAGRSGEDWFGRLRDDVRFLSQDVLHLGRDDLHVNGLGDMRTLAALAVYSWRKANRSEAVGAWASTLGITPARREPPQAQPQAPPPPETREPQRRRVFHP
jgi:lysophospholipase L1-like esterase